MLSLFIFVIFQNMYHQQIQNPTQTAKKYIREMIESGDKELKTGDIIFKDLTNSQYDKFAHMIWLKEFGIIESILQGAIKNSNRFLNSNMSRILAATQSYPFSRLFYQKIAVRENTKLKKLKSEEKVNATYDKMKASVKKQITSLYQESQLAALAYDLYEINKNKSSNKQLHDIIEKILKFNPKKNIYEQICYNWLKKQAEDLRKDETNLCCKLIFFENDKIKAQQSKNQEFKKYTWPITNTNIIFHITKTIVGFLNNQQGGIIYIGLYEDKEKDVSVKGIALQENQLTQLRTFFAKRVDEIYPKHRGFRLNDSSYKNIKDSKEDIKINDYVSINYQAVAKHDFTNAKQEKQKIPLYIVKVCVRPGHPKHLYHLLNQQQNLDFFVRTDRNVQKKAFPDAHEMIIQRLQRFEQAGDDRIQYRKFHDDCLFEVNVPYDLDSSDSETDD